ncbi:hypothetical protein ON010_g11125 [Phytophthora cinnamomi]|nr:hypothetical protein ON010_g11125 [Phytophthora cinnamomi]
MSVFRDFNYNPISTIDIVRPTRTGTLCNQNTGTEWVATAGGATNKTPLQTTTAAKTAAVTGNDPVAVKDKEAAWDKDWAPIFNMLTRRGSPHNITGRALGDPDKGTNATNRRYSIALSSWAIWSKEVEKLLQDIDRGTLIQDDNPVQRGFVPSQQAEDEQRVATEQASVAPGQEVSRANTQLEQHLVNSDEETEMQPMQSATLPSRRLQHVVSRFTPASRAYCLNGAASGARAGSQAATGWASSRCRPSPQRSDSAAAARTRRSNRTVRKQTNT